MTISINLTEAKNVRRVAHVIVGALAKADDHTMPGTTVCKAIGSRDRRLVYRALEYLVIGDRIKVERRGKYRGLAGIKITLLDGEEQQTK